MKAGFLNLCISSFCLNICESLLKPGNIRQEKRNKAKAFKLERKAKQSLLADDININRKL